jgi:lipopolysaccharide/colanic/teichoic acid biosynthesis glycosyltransferase
MATTASESVPLDSYPGLADLPSAPAPRRRTLTLHGPGSFTTSTSSTTTTSSTLDAELPICTAVGDDVSLVASAPHHDQRLTRALNVTVAAIGLVIMLPVILLIALAVKLTSPGGVFYTQRRIGLDRRWNRKSSHEQQRVCDLGGRPFTIYKFRTMVPMAEAAGEAVWASPDDERVTPVGRFLRASRLDELPQLWNVLRGEMNVVGPRPERPEIFAELRESIPLYHMRQRVMPGITGWAQINQCYDQNLDDVRRKVNFDLEYLGTRSVGQDLRIMARTVPVMLGRNLGW